MADRVAIVTGANTGIGLAIAERLLADGWNLGYATQDDDKKHEGPLVELQKRHGDGRIHWVWGSLADLDVPERLVAETVEALGGVDALVNNAGLSTAKPFLELTADDFDLTFEVDVRGSFLASQAAARRMKEHGGGSIVNITSVHEHIPRPSFAVYAGRMSICIAASCIFISAPIAITRSASSNRNRRSAQFHLDPWCAIRCGSGSSNIRAPSWRKFDSRTSPNIMFFRA